MLFQKRILSIAGVIAIGVLPALAGQTTKSAATSPAKKAVNTKPAAAAKVHTAEGSIVVATDDSLTLRTSGKKNMNFKLSSTTQKPSSMNPGSNVTVSYHDEGNQHIATAVQMAPTKSNAAAAKPPASK